MVTSSATSWPGSSNALGCGYGLLWSAQGYDCAGTRDVLGCDCDRLAIAPGCYAAGNWDLGLDGGSGYDWTVALEIALASAPASGLYCCFGSALRHCCGGFCCHCEPGSGRGCFLARDFCSRCCSWHPHPQMTPTNGSALSCSCEPSSLASWAAACELTG